MHQMRRKDREMNEEFAWQVVDACDYAVLSTTDEDGVPYGVPLNIVRRGTDVYFHCAQIGKKTACLRRDPRVSITCVGTAEIYGEDFTTLYASAMLFGEAEEVTDEAEKIEALRALCVRYTPAYMDGFEKALAASLRHTAIWKIRVKEISGKANQKPR